MSKTQCYITFRESNKIYYFVCYLKLIIKRIILHQYTRKAGYIFKECLYTQILSPQTFDSKPFNPTALSCQSSAGQPLLTLNASI